MFADRLVNDEDRTWFSNLLSERMTADFQQSFDAVVTSDPLLYADFMSMTQDSRVYVEVSDHAKVRLLLDLTDYCRKYFHSHRFGDL